MSSSFFFVLAINELSIQNEMWTRKRRDEKTAECWIDDRNEQKYLVCEKDNWQSTYTTLSNHRRAQQQQQ